MSPLCCYPPYCCPHQSIWKTVNWDCCLFCDCESWCSHLPDLKLPKFFSQATVHCVPLWVNSLLLCMKGQQCFKSTVLTSGNWPTKGHLFSADYLAGPGRGCGTSELHGWTLLWRCTTRQVFWRGLYRDFPRHQQIPAGKRGSVGGREVRGAWEFAEQNETSKAGSLEEGGSKISCPFHQK